MALFRNPYESHFHSTQVLNLLYEYDSFLDSVEVVADMGCGSGLDTKWWATLQTRDDPPVPHNYMVYAVDKNISQLEQDAKQPNVITIEDDFEHRIVPRQVDVIWAHDVLQYAVNPMGCLAAWRETLNVDGMLIVSVPQITYMEHGRLRTINHSNQYHSFNTLNLMYMLAMNGFDCRDAYFYREPNTPWLYAAVYASEHRPLPSATWYDLADRNLINDSVISSVHRHGHARLEDIYVCWLDKNNYLITD
jgi:SAM-dependent methyltransferase